MPADDKIEEIIALNIRKRRNALGWSQQTLAEKADISLRGIQAIENEGRIPRAVNIFKIARALGVAVDELYIDENRKGKLRSKSKSDLIASVVLGLPTLKQDELRFVSFVITRLPLIGTLDLARAKRLVTDFLSGEDQQET